jgi:hypothetical protein
MREIEAYVDDELESVDRLGFAGRGVQQLVCLPVVSYIH